MERRALLAVAISVLILVLYQELVLKRYFPPPAENLPEVPVAAEPGDKPESAPPLAGAPGTEPLAPEAAAGPTARDGADVAAPEGHDVIVETQLYRAVLTTAGARLKSFELKNYKTTIAPDSALLDLVGDPDHRQFPFAVTLRGAEEQVADRLVTYRVDRDRLELAGDATGTVTFTGEVQGITITKSFEIKGDSYFVSAHVRADAVGPAYTEMAIGWPKTLPPTGAKNREVVFDSVLALEADKVRQEKFDGLQDGKLLDKEIGWFAYSGKYFLAAMMPAAQVSGSGATGGLRVWLKRHEDTVEAAILLPPGRFDSSFDVYVGPKELDRLSGHPLRRAVDLGWFSFVALPMLQVLRLSHSVSNNYGIDIILLTIVIKVLFYPLTQKSFQSMREMQKLQPQMTAIRERLKDKPDEMNKEVMELYRRNKVNPLGGCLPMLLQMPVFIGLYQALLNSVELRHAPFAGWINDLSAPDRLGSLAIPFVEPPGFPVLTLLMGASMVVQQWMTPMTTADPTQQRMMMLMPVIFTFMFISFPSGLTLYWLVNNILTIAQQYVVNRAAPSR